MSSSRTKKRKGAPSGAPSRTSGRKRRTADRGALPRAASPFALILAVLIALGSLGYWVQSKTSTPELTPDVPTTTQPETAQPTAPTTPTTTQPNPPTGTTLPDGRPATWAKIDRAAGASETMLQTIYWLDGRTGDRLQPIEVRQAKTAGTAKAAVEQLLNPPRELQLASGFPAGTKLNDARLVGTVLTVDLTKEVETVDGSAGASTIMAQLVYTLTELPGVESVRLTANGFPAVLHGMEWTEPLSREQLAERNLLPVENVIRFDG